MWRVWKFVFSSKTSGQEPVNAYARLWNIANSVGHVAAARKRVTVVPTPDPKQCKNNWKNDMSLFPAINYERHSEQLLHWPRLSQSCLASLLPTSPQLSGEGGETSFHIAQVCRVECGLRLAQVLHHACRWSDFKKVFKDRCSIKLAKETQSPLPILQQTNNQHG